MLHGGVKKPSAREKASVPSDMIETATRIILGEQEEENPKGKTQKRTFLMPFLFGCLFSAFLFGAVALAFLL